MGKMFDMLSAALVQKTQTQTPIPNDAVTLGSISVMCFMFATGTITLNGSFIIRYYVELESQT